MSERKEFNEVNFVHPNPSNFQEMPRIDVAGHPLSEAFRMLRQWVTLAAKEDGLVKLYKTGDESVLSDGLKKELVGYRKVLSDLHESVTNTKAKTQFSEIEARYQNNSQKPIGEHMNDIRKGAERTVVFDFDNTITDSSKYRPGVADPLLLGSQWLDYLIGKNRVYQVPVIAGSWQPLAYTYPDLFADGGKQVPFRDGMKELLETLIKNKINVKIISTNFAPFIESAIKRIEGGENVEVFCVRHKDVRSTQKGDMLKMIQLENPNHVLEYVGDGSTDFSALEARGIIPGFHALQGESFDRLTSQQNIPHFTFKNGYELAQNLGVPLEISAQPA